MKNNENWALSLQNKILASLTTPLQIQYLDWYNINLRLPFAKQTIPCDTRESGKKFV